MVDLWVSSNWNGLFFTERQLWCLHSFPTLCVLDGKVPSRTQGDKLLAIKVAASTSESLVVYLRRLCRSSGTLQRTDVIDKEAAM